MPIKIYNFLSKYNIVEKIINAVLNIYYNNLNTLNIKKHTAHLCFSLITCLLNI